MQKLGHLAIITGVDLKCYCADGDKALSTTLHKPVSQLSTSLEHEFSLFSTQAMYKSEGSLTQ